MSSLFSKNYLTCKYCGRKFYSIYAGTLYCSKVCKADQAKKMRAYYKAYPEKKPTPVPRKHYSRHKEINPIVRLSIEAREHGMSYGNYVAMLKENEKGNVK